MTLTRDYKQTIIERAKADPEFSSALFDEAISLFLHGEVESSRLIMRDLVNATVGFEALAQSMNKSSKSLHRMLSSRGNPTMDNLAEVIVALQTSLKLDAQVHIAPLA